MSFFVSVYLQALHIHIHFYCTVPFSINYGQTESTQDLKLPNLPDQASSPPPEILLVVAQLALALRQVKRLKTVILTLF